MGVADDEFLRQMTKPELWRLLDQSGLVKSKSLSSELFDELWSKAAGAAQLTSVDSFLKTYASEVIKKRVEAASHGLRH